MTASVAVDAQEAMGEHAALEVGTNLALDETSDGSTRGSGAREERLHILADDAMEERLLGLVAFVPVDGGEPIGTGRRQEGRSQSGPCEGIGARGELAGTRPPTRLRVEVRVPLPVVIKPESGGCLAGYPYG